MEETVKLEMTKEESQQFQALIEECLTQMRQSIERIDRDQEEIDQLRIETRIILDQIKAALNVETIL
jgi:hypothetical protein